MQNAYDCCWIAADEAVDWISYDMWQAVTWLGTLFWNYQIDINNNNKMKVVKLKNKNKND